MQRRIEKLNALIRAELGGIFLKDIEFPDNAFVTITRVETSANLIESKVFISVFPSGKTERVFTVLNKIIYGIQQKINRRLRMRPIPRIIFLKEEKIESADKVEGILEKLKKEENKIK